MNKFKVGDFIKGLPNEYAITNEKMRLAEVLRVNNKEMNIQILSHKNREEEGCTYNVINSADYFKLSDDDVEIIKKDIEKLKRYLCAKERLLKRLECKPILDKEEKEYLKAVIKPFKKEVIGIVKRETGYDNEEYINIQMECGFDAFSLPNFKKGTMYKGMILNKEYTLKEFGLDE